MWNGVEFRDELKIIDYYQRHDSASFRFESKRIAQDFRDKYRLLSTKSRIVGSKVTLWFHDKLTAKRFMYSLYKKQTNWSKDTLRHVEIRREYNANEKHERPLADGPGQPAGPHANNE